jgi:uracil-DNA glycosylase family 4
MENAKSFTNVNQLFELSTKSINNYDDMIEFVPMVQKQGFFPICTGTIDGSTDLSKLNIMIVGQDFGTKIDYDKKKIAEMGENIEKQSTWKNLKPMLNNLGINPNECFYTNLLLGLRTTDSNVGISPALENEKYVSQCVEFFQKQIDAIQPKLIIFLGKVTYAICAEQKTKKSEIDKLEYIKNIIELNKTKPTYYKINCLYMIHPSFRPQQLGKKFWSEDDEINYYKN